MRASHLKSSSLSLISLSASAGEASLAAAKLLSAREEMSEWRPAHLAHEPHCEPWYRAAACWHKTDNGSDGNLSVSAIMGGNRDRGMRQKQAHLRIILRGQKSGTSSVATKVQKVNDIGRSRPIQKLPRVWLRAFSRAQVIYPEIARANL